MTGARRTSGSSAIGSGITFNDIGSASLSVSSGTLSLQGGGTIFEQQLSRSPPHGSLDFNATFTASSAINATGLPELASFSSGTTNSGPAAATPARSTIAQGGTGNFTSPITAVGSNVTVTGGVLNWKRRRPDARNQYAERRRRHADRY